jgi:IgGFc binding protein
MRRARELRAAGAGAFGLLSLVAAGACSDDRTAFTSRPEVFEVDASVEEPVCGVQCSVDGRSIVDTCSNKVLETCPPELACGAARCQEPCAAAAADRRSNGCEFYFQPPHYSALFPQSCFATFIVNTSAQPLDLSLEYEGKALDLSSSLFRTTPGSAELLPLEGSIPAGESAVLFVLQRTGSVRATNSTNESHHLSCPLGTAAALYADYGPGTRINSALRLKANVPASVVAIYPWGGAASFMPSATLLLPVPNWGKEHVIVNAWESSPVEPAAQIVASEDDTEVTITPNVDLQNGAGIRGGIAKSPLTYHLDKGQLLQFVQGSELTGSFVTSTKPTSVFGGHGCMNIPSKDPACDAANQQLPAFEQWGREYVGVGYRPRTGSEGETMLYKIVAAKDGTRLDYDPAVPGGAPVELAAGESAIFKAGVGEAFSVRTQDVDHPVYLAAYMTAGSLVGGAGDPEFVNVVPAGQYLSSYSFYADPTYKETSLVIIRQKTHSGEFAPVWLECAGELTDFKPVGTRGEYEFTRVDLIRDRGPGDKFGDKVCQSGLHRMRSDGPFTATIWGWDSYASYAYPGGMAQRQLVTTPLVPVN